jgi:hypothetical protein
LRFVLPALPLLVIENIEDDSVPAVLAHQRPINPEEDLLPGTEFCPAVRTGIKDLLPFVGKRLA